MRTWVSHGRCHTMPGAMGGPLAHLLPEQRTRAIGDALRSFQATPKPPLRVVYSTRAQWPADASHIAVLDASFNPPTKAHLGLAMMPRTLAPIAHFDAHLLVFSVRNADKGGGRAGDATPQERVEMIELLAKQMEADLAAKDAAPNVAVAVVDEPLVFAKSTLVRNHFELPESVQLAFLMGGDTITRVFTPKYYGSESRLEEMCARFFGTERSHILCATRSDASVQARASSAPPDEDGDAHELRAWLDGNAAARRWIKAGSIEIRTLASSVAAYSSTAVRRLLASGGEAKALHDMVPATLVEYLLERRPYGTDGPTQA